MEGQAKPKEEKHVDIMYALVELENTIEAYRKFRDKIRGTDKSDKPKPEPSQITTLAEVLELTPQTIRNACVELLEIKKTLNELLF